MSSTTLKSSPIACSTNTAGAGAGALLASLDTVVFWLSEPALAAGPGVALPAGAGPVLVVVSLAFSAITIPRVLGATQSARRMRSAYTQRCAPVKGVDHTAQ